jgi:hypothetical protein
MGVLPVDFAVAAEAEPVMTKDELRNEIRQAACACEELAIGDEPIEGARLDELIEHATRLLADAKRYRGDVEPPASEGALKCPTCKRPFEEVAISELREYFEPTAAQEKFPGAARNAEEMKIYQAGYDHGFRDGEQSASGNRPCSGEGS